MKKLDTLDQIEVHEAYHGKAYVYAVVMKDNYWTLGVAVANEKGYSPIPLSWANIEMGSTDQNEYDLMATHAEELNKKIGYDVEASAKIITSTM